MSEQLRLLEVTHLRNVHASAWLIVAHVVCRDGGTETADEGVKWLAVSENPRRIDLQCSGHEIVHDLHFLDTVEALVWFDGSWIGDWLGDLKPVLFFGE